jgi:hypothetical protein
MVAGKEVEGVGLSSVEVSDTGDGVNTIGGRRSGYKKT